MSIDVLIAKASVFLGKQIVQNMFQTKGSILHSLTRLYNLSYRLSILRETKLEEITKASANSVEKKQSFWYPRRNGFIKTTQIVHMHIAE